jgi:hypothetical protein
VHICQLIYMLDSPPFVGSQEDPMDMTMSYSGICIGYTTEGRSCTFKSSKGPYCKFHAWQANSANGPGRARKGAAMKGDESDSDHSVDVRRKQPVTRTHASTSVTSSMTASTTSAMPQPNKLATKADHRRRELVQWFRGRSTTIEVFTCLSREPQSQFAMFANVFGTSRLCCKIFVHPSW